jgi:hypothetical protein
MFTSNVTVEFSPLPAEKEEAYWMALNYFAEVMLSTEVNENDALDLVMGASNSATSKSGNNAHFSSQQ